MRQSAPKNRTIEPLNNGSLHSHKAHVPFGAHGCDGDDFPVDSSARRFGTGSRPKLGGRMVCEPPRSQVIKEFWWRVFLLEYSTTVLLPYCSSDYITDLETSFLFELFQRSFEVDDRDRLGFPT